MDHLWQHSLFVSACARCPERNFQHTTPGLLDLFFSWSVLYNNNYCFSAPTSINNLMFRILLPFIYTLEFFRLPIYCLLYIQLGILSPTDLLSSVYTTWNSFAYRFTVFYLRLGILSPTDSLPSIYTLEFFRLPIYCLLYIHNLEFFRLPIYCLLYIHNLEFFRLPIYCLLYIQLGILSPTDLLSSIYALEFFRLPIHCLLSTPWNSFAYRFKVFYLQFGIL